MMTKAGANLVPIVVPTSLGLNLPFLFLNFLNLLKVEIDFVGGSGSLKVTTPFVDI